jgi:hypothetical protein
MHSGTTSSGPASNVSLMTLPRLGGRRVVSHAPSARAMRLLPIRLTWVIANPGSLVPTLSLV